MGVGVGVVGVVGVGVGVVGGVGGHGTELEVTNVKKSRLRRRRRVALEAIDFEDT